MKIELKNVKYAEFASEETHCFEATVYLDGKRAGSVSNSGKGGCNDYHPHQIEERINEYAKTLPATKWRLDDQELEIKQDADTVVGDLLMDYLYSRDLKKALAKRILFVSKDGLLKESKSFAKDKLLAVLANPELPKLVGSETILNYMPFSLALQTYRTSIAGAA